jgi:4-carboxymuconolactone decarboxylase
VICIISNHWQGEYVWTAHTRIAVKLGIPQSVFDAIRAGQEPVLDNERERAVYELARIAMQPGAGSDEVFTRAERLLGRNGIAEVLALLGYYSSVAMGVKLHRVPVPA